jgi:type III secretion protein U
MNETESKKHPPSAKKLRKLREDGSVPSGADLAGLIAAAAGIAALAGTAWSIWDKISAAFAMAPDLLEMPLDEALDVASGSFSRLLLMAVVPVVITVIFAGVIAGLLFNNGVVFAMKPVTPQIDRLSPLAGLKRIYGLRGWVEVAAAFVRIALWLTFAGMCSVIFLPGLIRSPHCASLCQAHMLAPLIWTLILGAIVLMLVYAGLDMLVQTWLFRHEQRMTETERNREIKDQFGSLELRKERARLRNVTRTSGPASAMPENANMLFWSGATAIAVLFDPPGTQVPYVLAKARSDQELEQLRKKLGGQRIFEYESEQIVKAGIGKDLGGMLDPSAFDEFARICRENG